MRVLLLRSRVVLLPLLLLLACAGEGAIDPNAVKATYDEKTGRLRKVEVDSNNDGKMDTWSYMDGTRLLRIESDKDEDGKIDQWEYYNSAQQLEKLGLSRANDGREDAWAYQGPDGKIARLEISTRRDGRIDRREWYAAGVVSRAEQDSDADGRPDKWETYTKGKLASASFDENGDGQPDRRLSYDPDGGLVSIETNPDGKGTFSQKVIVRRAPGRTS
ncbi:MAG: hypothetical protein HYX76_14705 [Acidobacteria bacterium]|nr:hypothetical protein [Acidobacteriota bacterium]